MGRDTVVSVARMGQSTTTKMGRWSERGKQSGGTAAGHTVAGLFAGVVGSVAGLVSGSSEKPDRRGDRSGTADDLAPPRWKTARPTGITDANVQLSTARAGLRGARPPEHALTNLTAT